MSGRKLDSFLTPSNKVCRPSHSRGKPFPREYPRRGYSAGGIRETLLLGSVPSVPPDTLFPARGESRSKDPGFSPAHNKKQKRGARLYRRTAENTPGSRKTLTMSAVIPKTSANIASEATRMTILVLRNAVRANLAK